MVTSGGNFGAAKTAPAEYLRRPGPPARLKVTPVFPVLSVGRAVRQFQERLGRPGRLRGGQAGGRALPVRGSTARPARPARRYGRAPRAPARAPPSRAAAPESASAARGLPSCRSPPAAGR